MLAHRHIGEYYEKQACKLLSANGLLLLDKNWSSRVGEIDLIMIDDKCLVFIEVRYRKNEYYGDAAASIDYKKQERIILSAYKWMAKNNVNNESCEYRFDVVAFTGNNYQWIKNAFSQ